MAKNEAEEGLVEVDFHENVDGDAESGEATEEILLLDGYKIKLSVAMTSVFLVGEMAGSGVLAMPMAIEKTGWIGLPLVVLCGFVCSYTGAVLAECWTIVQDRHPEYRDGSRNPYPDIGSVCFGRPGSWLVMFAMLATMVGGAVVFMLMTSENFRSIVGEDGGKNLDTCYYLLIVFAIVLPLSMFGTPKDFKYLGVCASLATTVACVILVVMMVMDAGEVGPVHHGHVDLLTLSMAFGTMLYAFGGHPLFPTLQNDMKQPTRFGTACRIAYSVLVLLYFPVAAGGYFVYGDKIKDNILLTVRPSTPLRVAQGLISLHLITTYVIILNPVFQAFERFLKISPHFTWKRVVARTFVCTLILLTALAVPHFGPILSLIGGSSMTLLAFVLPPIFYFRLVTQEGPWPRINIPLYKILLLAEILLFALAIGGVCTYAAFRELWSHKTFIPPCFTNMTVAN